MEPVGLTLGVAGLVGTFTACVDCFENVRIGRSFGEDYQTSIIKLDLVRLRFTRWGQSVGINEGDESLAVQRLKDAVAAPEKDFTLVKMTLGQILRLFKTVEENSSRLAMKASKAPTVTTDDMTTENGTIRALHESMRNLAVQRQKRSSTLQKVSWALFRKREFAELVANLTNLVSELVELAPAMSQQQQLCKQEMTQISNDRDLVLLHDILQQPVNDDAVSLDEHLRDAVTEAIKERKGTMTTASWKRSRAGDGLKIQQGDRIADNYQGQVLDRPTAFVVEDSEFGLNVDFHQGNRYGR